MEIWLMNWRCAFAETVFEKKAIAGDPKSKPRYGITLIAPPTHPQIEIVRGLEAKLCNEHEWKDKSSGTDVLELLRRKGDNSLKDGDFKKKWDGFAGNHFVAASNETRPTVVNRDKSPLVASDGILYSGCYVNAKVDIWVQDNSWGQRLNTDLLGVQFVKDGDSFSAGSPPTNPDDFPNLDAGGDDVDADPFA